MDERVLDRFGAMLLEERERLRKELRDQGADPDDSTGIRLDLDSGFSDRAESTTERARLLSVIGSLRGELQEIEQALSRLTDGTYGRCERCGKDIPLERLEAKPGARLCIDCKQLGA